MKKDIHPSFNNLEIELPDGSKMITKSAYTKGKLLVDVNYKTHPAWTGGISQVNANADQVANYNKKFGNLGLFNTAKTANE
jgi:large subunit ribosomal protein L31